MKKSRFTWFVIMLAVISLSCNLPSASGITNATQPPQAASPTGEIPTATLPPVATDTATLAPTATQAPTVTDTPTPQGPAQVIPAMNAYCRKGPGTGYYIVTTLQTGTAYNVTGRNSPNTWWLVQATQSVSCWMGDPNATKQGPVDQAPVVNVTPLPQTPGSFSNTYVCNSVTHALTVSLQWTGVANVTGYHIYRNGKQLTTAAASATSYHDGAAPGKVNVVYELEAFNDYGVANRISTSVPAC